MTVFEEFAVLCLILAFLNRRFVG